MRVRITPCKLVWWGENWSQGWVWCDPPEKDLGMASFAFVGLQASPPLWTLLCPHCVLFLSTTKTIVWMEFRMVFAVLRVLGFPVCVWGWALIQDSCCELDSGGSGMGHLTPHVKGVFSSHFVAVLVLMLKWGSKKFNICRLWLK